MSPIRLACVRYLNAAPLVDGLESLRGLEIVRAVPSRIADLVRSREADLGLASVVDAFGEGLTIVPAGMIGCDGPTLTVRVFSGVPFDRVETLHADTDSHTSVALARVILSRVYGRGVRVVDFDARERVPGAESSTTLGEAWPETVLLIGDKVVVDHPPADRYPHQLDLGEAWKALTGLPFVYAAWMCRDGEEGSAPVRVARAVLERQVRHNATRLGWIATRRAAAHRWPAPTARRYLSELLRYRLGSRERTAVERFAHEAHALGLVGPGGVRWAD